MRPLSYLDFELKITHEGENYRVHVYHSPAGEATGEFSFTLVPLEIENLLLKMTRLRSASRAIDSPEMAAARKLGRELFFNYVNSVAFSPDGDLLAAGFEDQVISIWELRQ